MRQRSEELCCCRQDGPDGQPVEITWHRSLSSPTILPGLPRVWPVTWAGPRGHWETGMQQALTQQPFQRAACKAHVQLWPSLLRPDMGCARVVSLTGLPGRVGTGRLPSRPAVGRLLQCWNLHEGMWLVVHERVVAWVAAGLAGACVAWGLPRRPISLLQRKGMFK